jgi:hypothetical protein
MKRDAILIGCALGVYAAMLTIVDAACIAGIFMLWPHLP